jgi:hypothetical protein
MINYKSILFIFMIDLCFKFIYDQIFTLKLVNESCKEKNNIAEEIIDGLFITPVSTIVNLFRKTILNFVILIVCLFVFKIKLFSYDSVILIIITILNNLISRYVIYYRHICEEKKELF